MSQGSTEDTVKVANHSGGVAKDTETATEVEIVEQAEEERVE